MIWVAILFAGCEEAAVVKGGERQLANYVGVPGTRIELAPSDAPDEPPLHLLIGEDSWTLRLGENWEDAAPVAEWAVSQAPALVVEGEGMLSMPVPDSVVTTTWYGEFGDSVQAAPESGAAAGAWAFANGIGPIVATVDNVGRECVFYEYEAGGLDDTGDG